MLDGFRYGSPLPYEYYCNVSKFPDLEARVRWLSRYLPPIERRFLCEKAYPFANKWHEGQTRQSGEPYIEHPVAVAEILSKYNVPVWVLAAALLHDTYEDSEGRLSLEVIGDFFGPYMRSAIDGLTKIGKASSRHRAFLAENPNFNEALNSLTAKRRRDIQTEIRLSAKWAKIKDQMASLAKLLLGMAEEPTVMLIKIADRLHNMRTMANMRKDKQKRISRDTLKVYIPIAWRFGIWEMKTELENLCFRYCYPEVYKRFQEEAVRVREHLRPYWTNLRDKIAEALEKDYIAAEVSVAANSDYSVLYRMKSGNLVHSKFHGLNFIRILTDDPDLCHPAMECLKKLFRYADCRDYIRQPKLNGYKAIHMSFEDADFPETEYQLIGRKKIPASRYVDVQICSREDYERNKIGVFSVFKDKRWRCADQQTVRGKIREDCAPWLNSLHSLRESADSDRDFLDLVMKENLNEKITCFTPKGDAIALPIGSTPLDFAYMVHSALVTRCSGCLVNNMSVSILDYKLKDNDFVEILTSDDARPDRIWYDTCFTKKVKRVLSKWFLQNYSSEANIKYGSLIMETVFESERVSDRLQDEVFKRELARLCGCQDTNSLLVRLGARDLSGSLLGEKLRELIAARAETLVSEINPL
ncbi:bifunctional (p)ppGpp synthetase/guanosine-3',5'-bis(diphosphate) 3'-pyrophosphohydrolase [bacterium]|nr:bifunctional (p)ppGpp synthetase/guanosine-3',5'-bis(diphosphate) 3'-pyrophosphohydrolase [bacterium]